MKIPFLHQDMRPIKDAILRLLANDDETSPHREMLDKDSEIQKLVDAEFKKWACWTPGWGRSNEHVLNLMPDFQWQEWILNIPKTFSKMFSTYWKVTAKACGVLVVVGMVQQCVVHLPPCGCTSPTEDNQALPPSDLCKED